MNVLITGGTGLIGSALTGALVGDDQRVWILTRSPDKARLPAGVEAVAWDGKTTTGWLDLFNQMDAVINLAGETIGAWPWTAERKRRIRSSRMDAARAITSAFEKATRRPHVLIQSSGIGYYGACGDEVVDEESPAGNDFNAALALDWETSTRMIDALGVRRVIMRQAIVLTRTAGILPLMALPVHLFVGGPLGGGKQGLPWIHLEDEIGAIRFLLENEKARGVFNLCAPNTPSSADFVRTLAKTLWRPYWFPVPAFALRLALGGMSELLLHGQYAIPKRLIESGYVFKYETLFDALESIYRR
jgi:hypothetical protein